jgi:dolichol-phosphate mannosyltransferase
MTIKTTIPAKIGIPAFDEYVFRNKQNKYCLLIPIFNELKYFTRQIKNMEKNNVFKICDVVVCDAGSTDGSTDPVMLGSSGFSALLIRKGSGRYSTDMRMGYGWALERGYEGIISVDGTNKDGMEAVPLFIEKLEEGFDYIQGSRFIRGGKAVNTPIIRTLAIRFIADVIMSISAHKKLSDTTNGFRAYSSRVIKDKNIAIFRDSFNMHEIIFYLPVCCSRLGYKLTTIPVSRIYPADEIPTHATINSCIKIIKLLFNLLFIGVKPDQGKNVDRDT